MKKPLIIILDEHRGQALTLNGCLAQAGYEVRVSSSTTDVLSVSLTTRSTIVIIEASRNSGWDGVKRAEQIRQRNRRLPVILITSCSSEQLAIAALKAGVNDYFSDPLSFEELQASISSCVTAVLQEESTARHATTLPPTIEDLRMTCESRLMRDVRTFIARAAASDCNVLITGETGTGKQVAAELIHHHSSRHQKPFICVNCAAIPDTLVESELFGYEKGAFTGAFALRKGKFELAEGGSLLLDEIGDLNPFAQAKLLRAIETKEVQRLGGKGSTPVNTRIIAATNQEIDELAEEGRFRRDLYYRLNIARVHLPPLRDRKDDIPSLLDYYRREFNDQFGVAVKGFSAEALEALLSYQWPGNVRELRNVLEGTFVNAPMREISMTDFPQHFHVRLQKTGSTAQGERDRLLTALLATNWNKTKAAEKLHWSRMTVYRKMAKYDFIRWRGN